MIACILGVITSMSLSFIALIQTLSFSTCRHLKCCCGEVTLTEQKIQSPRPTLRPMTRAEDCWFSKID